jgi:hypothetical protein
MTDKSASAKRPSARFWSVAAAILAYGGLALMLVVLLTPTPDAVIAVSSMMIFAAVVPYTLALSGRFGELTQSRQDSLESLRMDMVASHEAQMAQIHEMTERIKATSQAIRLPLIEAEVYAEILGLEPDQVVLMEWPDDGLRDTVGVYLVDGTIQTHQLTIDQMNQAADTINERLTANSEEEPS